MLLCTLSTRVVGIGFVFSCSVQVQDALASAPAGTAQLDLVCAYMKRVYFFLYYRGQQCRDEGDMIASRGACRGIEAASMAEIEEVSATRPSTSCAPGLGHAKSSEACAPYPGSMFRFTARHYVAALGR